MPFAQIHAASAAKPHDHIGVLLLRQIQTALHIFRGGIGADFIEDRNRQPRRFERVKRPVFVTGFSQTAIRH